MRHYSSPEESFMHRTSRMGDCLIWTGSRDEKGYGRMNFTGYPTRVHRYAWERARGPIPPGWVVDHSCYNRACVNVDHLRLATPAQNSSNRAGTSAKKATEGGRNVYPRWGKYRVQINTGGALHRAGPFNTIEEAETEAERMRRDMFGAYAGRATTTAALGLETE